MQLSNIGVLGTNGLRVGLLGGSFDPPHEGHLHITDQAFKAFNLDKIWWLVSPGNPLKLSEPVSREKRIEACNKLINNSNVLVSDIEYQLNTRYTADTIKGLHRLYPKISFVWLMGADNLVVFHHWENWNWIMENIPLGFMARPGEQIKAGLSKTATRYRRYRLFQCKAGLLARLKPPAWSLIGGPMQSLSSSQIRSKGQWC